MDLCDKNHDEICFEERGCPFCDYMKKANNEMDDLRKEINDLQSELSAHGE
jgi:thioredoxin-related protein